MFCPFSLSLVLSSFYSKKFDCIVYTFADSHFLRSQLLQNLFFFCYKSLKIYFTISVLFILCLKGEPTEECVRCNKVYLASTAELKQGLCQKCLENPLPSDDQENEDDVTISNRHKKFSSKFLAKINEDITPSNTEEELSNDSSVKVEIA